MSDSRIHQRLSLSPPNSRNPATPATLLSQVHPTARSIVPCNPNINAIRFRLYAEVLPCPILGKDSLNSAHVISSANCSVGPYQPSRRQDTKAWIPAPSDEVGRF